SKIPVNVPTAGQMQAITRGPDELLVEIAIDDTVSLNGKTMSLDSLTTTLKQSHANYPDAKAIVRGEASGSLQRTVEVLQVVRRSGIENIGISTKRMNR
ncbi:MAG: biopolymer transporter ExbD, partial [Rubripirellula sp.]|nr:biopolymer transporter ExbD [Rubripirellula sp.]